MNLYAVFLPSDGGSGDVLERTTFVKQGFSREAFWLTPVWAARKKLWGAFGFWLVWVGFVAALAVAFRLDGAVTALIYLIGALGFGLESDRLEQSRLTKSGFALRAFALGVSEREAEEIFFAGPAATVPPPPPDRGEEAEPPPPAAAQAGAIDLLGLFHPGN
jgi:hypothetical protein